MKDQRDRDLQRCRKMERIIGEDLCKQQDEEILKKAQEDKEARIAKSKAECELRRKKREEENNMALNASNK